MAGSFKTNVAFWQEIFDREEQDPGSQVVKLRTFWSLLKIGLLFGGFVGWIMGVLMARFL